MPTEIDPIPPAWPPAKAIAVWGGVQCVALAAAAGGVRLWAHHPDPPESIALAELSAVQMVVAALLFPVLLRRAAAVTCVVAMIAPFDALAGVLSASTVGPLVRTALFTAVWVVGLATWARPVARSGGLGVSLALLASVGGVLLLYARAESAAVAGRPGPDPSRYGPLAAGLCVAADLPIHPVAWIMVAVPLLTGAIWAATRFNPRQTAPLT